MEITICCTNDLVAGLQEAHHYIANLIKNNHVAHTNNTIYINPYHETPNENVSWERTDIVINDYSIYKQLNKNKDTICSPIEYCNLMPNAKVFKIMFPFETYDCYLGTLVVTTKPSTTNNVKIIDAISKL